MPALSFCLKQNLTRTLAMLLPLFAAGAVSIGPAIAQAQQKPACSLEGLNLKSDPYFIATLYPMERQRPLRPIVCAPVGQFEFKTGGAHFTVRNANLFNETIGGSKQNAQLVTVESVDAAGPRVIGRAILGPDPLDGQLRFEPQVVEQNGVTLLRLAPRHDRIFRIAQNTLEAIPAFEWRDALTDYPDAGKGGQALSIDLEKMEGRIAITRDSNQSAGIRMSAFDSPEIALSRLVYADGKLSQTETSIVKRQKGEFDVLDHFNEQDLTSREKIKGLPAGVEACSFGAWSNDRDSKGLNVRAEPSAKAKVLGIVPPARKITDESEAIGPEPVRSEFRVIGFKEGWFLIEKIEAPGVRYGIAYPRRLLQPYKGRGWVSAAQVGGATAHAGLPAGRLYSAPNAEARFVELFDAEGLPLAIGMAHAQVLSCSGAWVRVRTQAGQTGWTRSLCSNQVTNCS